MDCCDSNGLNRIFGGRLVRQELRVYERLGPNARQQDILAQLEPSVPGGSALDSVLDIGCGIGAVGVSLLKRGAGSGTFVDVSAAYLRAARTVSEQAGVEEKATFYQDDFATSARPYPQADVVVLDRVVCCYPNATALLEKAARHSRKTLIFTYPRPFWFMPFFRTLCAFGMRVFAQEYRFFLHDPKKLLGAVTAAGHVQVVTHPLGLWQLVKVTKPLS